MKKQPRVDEAKEIEREIQKLIGDRVFIKKSKLARILDMSRCTLDRELNLHNIPSYKNGRDARIRVSDVSRFMHECKLYERYGV